MVLDPPWSDDNSSERAKTSTPGDEVQVQTRSVQRFIKKKKKSKMKTVLCQFFSVFSSIFRGFVFWRSKSRCPGGDFVPGIFFDKPNTRILPGNGDPGKPWAGVGSGTTASHGNLPACVFITAYLDRQRPMHTCIHV